MAVGRCPLLLQVMCVNVKCEDPRCLQYVLDWLVTEECENMADDGDDYEDDELVEWCNG